MQATRFMLGLAAAVTGACGLDVGPTSDLTGSPEGTSVSHLEPEPGGGCRVDVCGDTSPDVDGVDASQIYLGIAPEDPDPDPDPDGVWITAVRARDGTPMWLALADGDRLLGVDPSTGSVIAEGASLVGARIEVAASGAPYELRVAAAAPGEPRRTGARRPIWEYELRYRPLAGPARREQPLCPAGRRRPDQAGAIVSGGELHARATGPSADGPATEGWINVACVHPR